MEKCLISVTQQLAIIKIAKEHLNKYGIDNSTGLCGILKDIILSIYKPEKTLEDRCNTTIIQYLPTFTHENAVKYAGVVPDCKNMYWWSVYPYDFEGRLKFLDWMEEGLLK